MPCVPCVSIRWPELADEFFDQALDRSLHRLFDDEGRPLGEHRLSADLRAGVPMLLRSCPYPGSRHHHPNPMNVSALRQMRRRWKEILADVRVLRSRYFVRHPCEPASLDDAFKIARIGVLLPAYFMRQGALRAERRLPARLAALYKVLVGYVGLFQNINIDRALNGGEVAVETSAERIMAQAEAENLFIGPQQVCAGPAFMISEVLELLAGNDTSDAGRSMSWAGRESLDAALDYGERTIQLDSLKTLFSVEVRDCRRELCQALGDSRGKVGPDLAPMPGQPQMAVWWDTSECPEEERQELHDELRTRLASHLQWSSERLAPLSPRSKRLFAAYSNKDVGLSPDRLVALEEALKARSGFAVLPEAAQRSVLRLVSHYLEVEMVALDAFDEGRMRIGAALGHERDVPGLGGRDVTAVFGETARDVITAAFGVPIRTAADKLIVG